MSGSLDRKMNSSCFVWRAIGESVGKRGFFFLGNVMFGIVGVVEERKN